MYCMYYAITGCIHGALRRRRRLDSAALTPPPSWGDLKYSLPQWGRHISASEMSLTVGNKYMAKSSMRRRVPHIVVHTPAGPRSITGHRLGARGLERLLLTTYLQSIAFITFTAGPVCISSQYLPRIQRPCRHVCEITVTLYGRRMDFFF